MPVVWRSLAAAAVVILFVFLVGYFEFRIAMLEQGLIVSWDLVPLSAATPAVAYLEALAMFIIFGVVAFVFLVRRRGVSGDTGVPAMVGGLVLLGLVVWQQATVTHELVVPAELDDMSQTSGWAAAFEAGALSTATLGMSALLLVIALLRHSALNTVQVAKSSRSSDT